MVYERVLVAVDGYAPSLGAAKAAIEMAAQQGSEVIVLCVEDDSPTHLPETGQITANPWELIGAYGEQHGVTIKKHCVTIGEVEEPGRIVDSMLRVAEEHRASVIVVGDSGEEGRQEAYFSNVAHAVAEGTHIPVLIIESGRVDISDMVSLVAETQDGRAAPAAPLVFHPEVFRKELIFSGRLFAIFATIYFGAAMLTSAPFKDAAAVLVLDLPLGLWVGWIAILSGVVIVRTYLHLSTRRGS